MKNEIKWLDDVEEHDYPAAESYLLLHFTPAIVSVAIKFLRRGDIQWFKAKDIFRASGLSLLGVSNSHIARDRRKIKEGRALSPLLLYRSVSRLIIADGYHRLCIVYQFDEDALVPCKIY